MARKRVRLTSPIGVAKFPYLTTPDTKFKAEGEYSVNLILDPEECADFLADLDALADEAVEKAKQDLIEKKKKAYAKAVVRANPYRPELDQDGNETGMIEVRFKSKASFQRKDGTVVNIRPRLFDAKGAQVDPSKVTIYSGSVLRVNFTPNPYYVASLKSAGVSLLLNAVQILELVEYGGGSAEDFGFEVEEGFDFTEKEDSSFEDDDNDVTEDESDTDDDNDEDIDF